MLLYSHQTNFLLVSAMLMEVLSMDCLLKSTPIWSRYTHLIVVTSMKKDAISEENFVHPSRTFTFRYNPLPTWWGIFP